MTTFILVFLCYAAAAAEFLAVTRKRSKKEAVIYCAFSVLGLAVFCLHSFYGGMPSVYEILGPITNIAEINR